jgi:hypothetical protein
MVLAGLTECEPVKSQQVAEFLPAALIAALWIAEQVPLDLRGAGEDPVGLEVVALGNRGGLISLLDPDGLKVDGVAYTKAQAEREG